MRVAKLADKIGGAHQLTLFALAVDRVMRGETRVFDSVRYSFGVELLALADALHHEQLRPLDVVRQERGIRRTTRQFDLVAFAIDHVAIFAVAAENTAHIADIMQQTGDEEVRDITGIGRAQQSAALDDVITHERDQHRVLDVMIKRIAIADALKSDSGNRRDQFGQMSMGRTKISVQMLGKERA